MSLIGWETAVVSLLALLIIIWFQRWLGELLVDCAWIVHQELVYAFVGITVLLGGSGFLGSTDGQLIAVGRWWTVLFLELLIANTIVAFIFLVFKLDLMLLSEWVSRRPLAILLWYLQRHEIIVLLILKKFVNNIRGDVVDVNWAMSVAELICSLRVVECQLLLLLPLLHAHGITQCSAQSNSAIGCCMREVSWALLQYFWLEGAS